LSLNLLKNYLSLVGAEAFSKLLVFAAFVYIARVLGPAYFGYVEWAAAVLICAGLIVDQGLSSYGTREIAKNPERTAGLVAEVVTARFILAGISFLGLSIFALFFVRERLITELLLIFGISLLALPLHLSWVFQGHDRMHPVALMNIARYAIFAGAVFLLVRDPESILFIAVAETAAVCSVAILSIWMYRRSFPLQIKIRPAFSGSLFREGLPIGLSQIFWVVKMYGATLIVGSIATAEETGYFAGAMRIFIALHAFVWLYYLNLLPSLSREWQKGRKQFSELISGSLRIVLTVSLLVTIVWVLFAQFITTLAYGQKFAAAAAALQWLAGVCAVAAISGHYRFGLIAAGQQNKEMLTAALGAVLALVLIPLGYFEWGIRGAAAGLFLTEIIVLGVAWLIAQRTLFTVNTLQNNCIESLPEASR
jgi:O-antigen/teichoic acid export membrane protein